ncbi:hypothetical protein [Pseudomonas sp. NFACC10-1]|uniref:hypothetical protein n=1 Tax=Pseudomonas sp. NFACC10-1 TaxID=1566247 RepID=UPI0009305784|nr:hypothetical protein [Pseudomonas sp. NFACC10-1]
MHAPPSVCGGGKSVGDAVLRVTGMEPDQKELQVSNENKREVALEQAAVALLSEMAKHGIDLSRLGGLAKSGIMGNAMYTWVSDTEIKSQACEAIDYLIGRVEIKQG